MLQAGSLLCFDKLVEEGTDPAYAEKTDSVRLGNHHRSTETGRITLMMDRLSNPAETACLCAF
ncbi:ketol-acid reductoisomerase [Escherichia coli]|uniref:Ketol-acid reductoisomerase (NADP(+)) n=1 Tax=Escherichia coli TaxID=562 RepID=A0A377B6H2_ECOLX|nr:ketol-acid reductoisomerase [Escherichia coli]